MSVTDLMADQLTVIRNAIMAGKKTVTVKRSSMIESMVEIIKKEGFIEDYQVIEDNKQGKIKIYLKWLENGLCAIEDLQKVSTPGLRVYVSCEDVPEVMGGVGISIVSTSKGLLSNSEAKAQRVGGEIICKVW